MTIPFSQSISSLQRALNSPVVYILFGIGLGGVIWVDWLFGECIIRLNQSPSFFSRTVFLRLMSLLRGAVFILCCVGWIVVTVRYDSVDKPDVRLLKAIRDGKLQVVDSLLKRLDVNIIKHRFGSTPLHWAAINGRPALIRSLLAHGADLDAEDNDGFTPLHYASDSRYENAPAVVEILLAHGADVNAKSVAGVTPLHCVTLQKDYYGCTGDPHMFLTREQYEDSSHEPDQTLAIMNLLLAHGAELTTSISISGETPLHDASRSGLLDLVERLLSSGADASIEDKEGRTPLARAKNSEIVNVFHRYGVTK